MVAEREAKVQQLELEIGQLSMQVSRALAWPDGQFQAPVSLSTVQRNLSNFQAFHLLSLRPRHVLPGSTLVPCFHLASHAFSHTFPLVPDCLPSLHKNCLWLPVTVGLTQSSRVQAPSSSSSPTPSVALMLTIQDGGYSARLYVHIPGGGMAERKLCSIQLAGPHVTSSCCHPSCFSSSPLPFLHTLATWPPFSSSHSPAFSSLQACAHTCSRCLPFPPPLPLPGRGPQPLGLTRS